VRPAIKLGGLQAALLFTLLAWCAPAHAQLSLVQCWNNFASGSAGTLAVTISPSNSAGSLMVGVIRQGSNNTAMDGVSDSATQTWTQISSGVTNWDTSTAGFGWYMPNSAALTSVTFDLGANNTNRAAVVCEVSGAATSSPEDSSVNSNTASLVSSLTSGSLTTTNADDILFYMVYTNGARPNRTAGSGYTIPTGGQDSSGRIAVQYQIVSSTQSGVTTSMSWTGGGIQAASIFAAFKQAAGGGAATPMRTLMGVGQ
jgi:hypothetical protein